LALADNRHRRSFADEQVDLGNIAFQHGNSLRWAICTARIERFLIIGRDRNFRSNRITVFPNAIEHEAGAAQIVGCQRSLLIRNQTRMNVFSFDRPLDSDQRMKNSKADDYGLDQKEDGVELMIPFVSCDCGRHQTGEVKCVTDVILRS
jgi:hypothetical protein